MAESLGGLRVLEVGTGKAIAYAGKLLRDLGAEVVKVEPRGGDALREYGPFPGDVPDPGHSGLFIYTNAGKRSARLDLGDAGDRASLESLLAGADVLLHSFAPAEAQSLGLQAEALQERQPRLIVTAITPYGSTGPYADWRGYALQAQAGSALAYRSGSADREPITSALDQAEIQHGAVQAAAATVLALVHRNRIGRGQFVDISVMDAVTHAVSGARFPLMHYLGSPPAHRPGRRFSSGPWGVYSTADGRFDVITLLNRQWLRFLDLMGEPEWAQDPVFRNVEGRVLIAHDPETIEAWEQHLREWFATHTTEQIWARTREARISFHPVHTIGEAVDSDQIDARRFMVPQPGPHPPLRVPGPPYRMSATPWRPPEAPPALDAAPAAAWNTSPAAEPNATELRAAGGDERLPLAGVRVLDLSQVWAGPLLARYLADYGADVILVETATRPRAIPAFGDDDSPAHWELHHRNRRSIHLDLSSESGVQLFKRLLATADVMLDNFTPRVMPNFGLGYEALAAEYPRLIIAALSACGRDGPWADLLSYGPSLTALYGAKSLHGYPPNEAMEDSADLDPISAGYGMLAIMAALNHRDRTGEGQMIEIAQGELALCGLAEAVIEHVWNQREIGPQGNLHRVLAPHGIYPCAGDDRWIAIACGADEEWSALAAAAEHPEWLTAAEFRSAAARREHRDELDAAIAGWTRDQRAEPLAERLQSVGVAAMQVMALADLLADPQHTQRRRHFRLGADFPGETLYNGIAWQLSLASPLLRHPVPRPGAQSEEVLGEVLGLTAAEVQGYREQGAIA